MKRIGELAQNREQAGEEYTVVGTPFVLAEKAPERHDELRLSLVQRTGEEPKVDIRVWTVHADGTERAHRGGLRLTFSEAKALRDALNRLEEL